MEYSDVVIEGTPERAIKLLMGIGAVASIRTLMAGAGMTDDDILEGRARPPPAPPPSAEWPPSSRGSTP
ncbi:uncharacterized protein SOCE26_053740 [Sorangium cellulosum]|uniref:Uncharacterized protein n=1 Tax=Sorangium cellulosum TaxID=56 RepID=A0A2L0EX98_SORCE|nr:hypothetical protein [Sorangium cellulosum]AUX43918.1 uncharacterized protein SOCE26_053740 [Sorangium cellulosum]